MKNWTTTVKDTGDGTGDVFIELPPAIVKEKGWTEKTELEMEVIDGAIHLSEKK